MRFRVEIPIAADTTVGTLRDVKEMLHGHGYPRIEPGGEWITFEWEPSDAEPSALSALAVCVAADELTKLPGAGRVLDEDEVRRVVGAALGAVERWREVVDELGQHGLGVSEDALTRVS